MNPPIRRFQSNTSARQKGQPQGQVSTSSRGQTTLSYCLEEAPMYGSLMANLDSLCPGMTQLRDVWNQSFVTFSFACTCIVHKSPVITSWPLAHK
ncbi:hypothetical protein RSAG8_13310, partial [Rhizoctonia solani AG-8 WAC10335]